MLKITTTFTLYFMSIVQQTSYAVEMADKLRENGKIYVVVSILVVILIGILLYLISLDKKITKLEQSQKQINE